MQSINECIKPSLSHLWSKAEQGLHQESPGCTIASRGRTGAWNQIAASKRIQNARSSSDQGLNQVSSESIMQRCASHSRTGELNQIVACVRIQKCPKQTHITPIRVSKVILFL